MRLQHSTYPAMSVEWVAFLLLATGIPATAQVWELSIGRDCLDKTKTWNESVYFNATENLLRCESNSRGEIRSLLVERDAICREDVQCDNINPCDLGCETHYRCQNSSECKLRSTICNGNACDGCPEELEWYNGPGFKCLRSGKECILPQQLLYDQIADCDGGSDLCFAHTQSGVTENSICFLDKRKCFQCLDGNMIVSAISVCDGIIDCADLSDECLCVQHRPDICNKVIMYRENTDEGGEQPQITISEGDDVLKPVNISAVLTSFARCAVGMVECRSGKCICRQQICDGISDCADDESYEACRGTIDCRVATKYEEACRCERRCESLYGKACDGKADCPTFIRWDDGYIPEGNPSPEDECKAPCTDHPTEFPCDDMYVMLNYPVGPGGIYKCKEPSTSRKDDIVLYKTKEKCDGVQKCPLGDDERKCLGRFYCADGNPQKYNIPNDRKCDGIEDCWDGSDETEKLCGSERFHCTSGVKVSISRNLTCDYMITCDDGSDEMNCTDGRFYCESGDPLFVRANQVLDGSKDCADWSDECTPSKNTLSSRYEMIGNGFLRALVWVMGSLSITGNLAVMLRQGKKLRMTSDPSPVQRANGFLVVNLAISDFLMGVYLISLAVVGLMMRGNYCELDLWWRSSRPCAILGVISAVSSETSVLTMVILTAFKLHAVRKPMSSRQHPKKRLLYLTIALSWVVSLTIALLPLFPIVSATFIKEAEFSYNPYAKSPVMTLSNTKLLFRRLLTYDAKENATLPDHIDNYMSAASWETLEADAEKYFKHARLKRVKAYGYYSSDSVCIAKFFVTRSEPAWIFSFLVNLFNSLAFTFVASAYIAIYAKTTKRKEIRAASTKRDSDGAKVFQRKILRLIVTDFVCWIPICVMAFCKLGGFDVSSTAYAVSAIVLLPINSALNPLLYSDLPDALLVKIRRMCSCTVTQPEGGREIQNEGDKLVMKRMQN